MNARKTRSTKNFRLKHCVEVQVGRGSGDTYFLFGKDAFSFDEATTDAFRVHRKKALADGLIFESQSRLESESSDGYLSFKEDARSLGLLFKPLQTAKDLTARKVIRAIENALAMWKPLTQFHPVFSVMAENPVTCALYLLELTYFVSRAATYFTVATRSAPNAKLRKIFSDFLHEEKDHYIDLLKGILVEPDLLAKHDPLAGTHALVSHLYFLADSDPESLLVTLSLFETKATDLESAKVFFQRSAADVAFDPKVFIAHHEEDLELGHAEHWAKHIRVKTKVSSKRAEKWIADLHMSKHMIDLWHDSIISASVGINPSMVDGKINVRSLIRPKPEWGSV